MFSDLDWKRYIGIAIVVLAFTMPAAYCTIRDSDATKEVRIACIQAKDNWAGGFGTGPHCEFPK